MRNSSTITHTGVSIVTSTSLSKTWPVACALPLPGGIAGPRKIATSGVATTLRASQRMTKRLP